MRCSTPCIILIGALSWLLRLVAAIGVGLFVVIAGNWLPDICRSAARFSLGEFLSVDYCAYGLLNAVAFVVMAGAVIGVLIVFLMMLEAEGGRVLNHLRYRRALKANLDAHQDIGAYRESNIQNDVLERMKRPDYVPCWRRDPRGSGRALGCVAHESAGGDAGLLLAGAALAMSMAHHDAPCADAGDGSDDEPNN